jgi:predicted AAA+ superfamily ATPase
MPDCINEFIVSKNLNNLYETQSFIDTLYKKDITQYLENNKEKLAIKEIFEIIPEELNSKNKRFILKDITNNPRYEKYKSSFTWLINAGVAIPVYNCVEPIYPLKLNEDRILFKFFKNDVGLLCSNYYPYAQTQILKQKDNINYGALYENVVAQELQTRYKHLFFFTQKKLGEIDFVIETTDKVKVIKVKSGKDYIKHSSFTYVFNTYQKYNNDYIILYNGNIKIKNNIQYLPIYMVMFL